MSLVLFDLDGTLVDTAPLVADLLCEVAASSDRTAVLERVRAVLANPAEEPLLDQLAALVDESDRSDESPAGSVREALIEGIAERAATGIRLYPGVYRLLLRLKRQGETAAIFSRWPEPLTLEILEDTGLRGYLDPVVAVETSEELSPLVRALTLLDEWDRDRGGDRVAPLWFVGDGKADLEAAAGAADGELNRSVRTVWVPHGYGASAPEGAAEELDRFGRLARLIG